MTLDVQVYSRSGFGFRLAFCLFNGSGGGLGFVTVKFRSRSTDEFAGPFGDPEAGSCGVVFQYMVTLRDPGGG